MRKLARLIPSLLLLMAGCAEKEVVPLFTPDPAAFTFAITQAAELQLYAKGCSAIDKNLTATSTATTQAWNQRNWPQVHAADQNYRQQLAKQTTQYQGQSVSLPAIKLFAEIESKISLKLDQKRHTLNNIRNYCQTKLERYRDGRLDISVLNPNADLYLKSLITTATPPAAYRVPSLAGKLKPLSKPGKSQFNLERSLVKWSCAGGGILTLLNEWPDEAYGVFCPSGKGLFVSCKWGQCALAK